MLFGLSKKNPRLRLGLVSTSASPPFQLEGASPPLLYHKIGVRCAHTHSGKPRFPSTHPTEALRLRLRAAFGVSCAHSSLRQQALACYSAAASPPLRAARPRNRNIHRRWAQSQDRIPLDNGSEPRPGIPLQRLKAETEYPSSHHTPRLCLGLCHGTSGSFGFLP